MLRALLVLQAPSAVFSALSDDDEDAQARQEPLLALVVLAGIAGVLGTSVATHLFDDPQFDAVCVAARALGGLGSYRRARHLVGFAAAPLALSLLVLWPVGLAVFGGDLFRTGGSDDGAGGELFE